MDSCCPDRLHPHHRPKRCVELGLDDNWEEFVEKVVEKGLFVEKVVEKGVREGVSEVGEYWMLLWVMCGRDVLC